MQKYQTNKYVFVGLLITVLLGAGCLSGGGDESVMSQASDETLGVITFDQLETTTGFLLLDDGSSSGTETNLQSLVENAIEPAFTLTANDDRNQNHPLKVSRIDISPTGEVYVLFYDSFWTKPVLIDSQPCAWIVINSDYSIDCVDDDIDAVEGPWSTLVVRDGAGTKNTGDAHSGPSLPTRILDEEMTPQIDRDGNIYYLVQSYDGSGDIYQIRKRDRNTGVVSTVLDAASINLSIRDCFVMSDESLVIPGYLTGLDGKRLFRFIPSSSGNGTLQEVDDGPVSLFLASDGALYSVGGSTGLIKGTLADGELAFSEVDAGTGAVATGSEIVEDSLGNIYVLNEATGSVVFANPGAFEEISITSIATTELSKASGDYLYETGENSDGDRVFIRKHLLGEREEVDLLGDRNLLVQQFDVADNGDVYFGALDLDTTTIYLYKYNNSTGELEQLDSLPGDLMQIVLL